MTNNNLTDAVITGAVAALGAEIEYIKKIRDENHPLVALYAVCGTALAELQQYRKAAGEPVAYCMEMDGRLYLDSASTCKGVVDSWVEEWSEMGAKTVTLYAATQLQGAQNFRNVTDFIMPPRISNIELRSPLEVEDICRAALRNMFARAGLRLHDHKR